jgi:hypothetical protein
LYKLKSVFYGTISKRQSSNSYRWRLHKKTHVLKFLQCINGFIYIQTEQFKFVLSLYDISFKQVTLTFTNAWFSGFFEAKGSVNINNISANFQITISILHKDKKILDFISNIWLGSIIYDNLLECFLWKATSNFHLISLFEYFTLFPLKSTKNADISSAKRFFRYKLLNYHQDPLKTDKLTHFVDLFQRRKKI